MTEENEARMVALVDRFYDLCDQDPNLGPFFRAAIPDMPEHKKTVVDFWSHQILGTGRYKGSVFAVHMNRNITPDQFDLWLGRFEKAAEETLTPEQRARAMAKARHMTQSIRMGLFPFHGMDAVACEKGS
ncbi:group III truncated hemoglobin [Rhodospirillum sp. A1_3_36]|uniref:group III truncated hemoglobin n=1 Tax=Rhodospirillum sp. A1_3_36 TaxID=3391666 RepID=UPI0039A64587